MTDKNGMYRNSIIQYLLNSQWFGKEKSHRRSHDFDGKTMLPLVTLALILTAVRDCDLSFIFLSLKLFFYISCAIDVWETGEKVSREFDRITYWPRYNKHLKKLTAWAAFSAKPNSVELAGGHDLCAELRKDLLRNSRYIKSLMLCFSLFNLTFSSALVCLRRWTNKQIQVRQRTRRPC